MKRHFIILLFWCWAAALQSQDTPIRQIDTVHITNSLVRMKNKGLYDMPESAPIADIGGFTALQLFDEGMGSEIWVSKEPACVTVSRDKTKPYSGEYCMRAKWDKIAGGCKWIGMGIGWDNWQPKDLSGIVDSACIQLMVRSQTDTLKSLPLALALEDYTGAQCFIGFSPKYLNGKRIMPGSWTPVTIPLSEFPFERFQTQPDLIKQFIIQFEADGDVYIDNIKLVRKSR
jgi:hypothetical protein